VIDAGQNTLRVIVPVASRFISPQNTDWKYAAKTLPSLSSPQQGVQIVAQRNLYADAVSNLRYGLAIAHSRGIRLAPRAWNYALTQDCHLSLRDVKQAQAILSYERYPDETFGLPVTWITSPTRRPNWSKSSLSEDDFERIVAWKRARAQKAAKLVFTTAVSLELFLEQSDPALRRLCSVIPFPILGISPIADPRPKWNQPGLRLLFVGREARRKGLPTLLQAVVPLLQQDPSLHLTIVSTLGDGPVSIPTLPNINHLRETSHNQVLQLMAQSHLLANPSLWESYGFVYVEAMSQGCVPMALDSPVQRELIGSNGILLSSQNPNEIQDALRQVICHREVYATRAQRGLDSYLARHTTERIAAQFYEAIRSTL
jgi:glycosyltransferase involved in cell wall biosynthesis